MKKLKKLALNRETLRHLTPEHLAGVKGGTSTVCTMACTWGCTGTCSCTCGTGTCAGSNNCTTNEN
jgi:hypothetical protein